MNRFTTNDGNEPKDQYELPEAAVDRELIEWDSLITTIVARHGLQWRNLPAGMDEHTARRHVLVSAGRELAPLDLIQRANATELIVSKYLFSLFTKPGQPAETIIVMTPDKPIQVTSTAGRIGAIVLGGIREVRSIFDTQRSQVAE